MKSSRIVLLVFGSLACVTVAPQFAPAEDSRAMQPPDSRKLVESDRVLVIAHRGNSSVAPENTLPAFRSAVELGADLVELDYFHSRDGVPVVFHDRELDRTTNAIERLGRKRVPIEQLTVQQLKQLDAGAWKDPAYQGTTIPTLAEALDVIQPRCTTLIERKGGDAATCVELLKQRQCLDRVVVQSFDWDYVARCRQAAPGLVLAALGDKELTNEHLDRVGRIGAQVVGWNEKHVAATQIEAAHARGLRIWVYTVNQVERMQQLVDQGIDGLITDHPEQALRLLHANR